MGRNLEITKKNEILDKALKNSKKESLMMKARVKDYEGLKNKFHEMECSLKENLKEREEIFSEKENLKKIDMENKSKLKKIEERLKKEEKRCSDTEAKASEYSKHISFLEEEKREFVVQMQHLETRTEELKQKIINLVT